MDSMITDGEKEFVEYVKKNHSYLQWSGEDEMSHTAPAEVLVDAVFNFCGCTPKEEMYELLIKYMRRISHFNKDLSEHKPGYYTDFLDEIFDGDEIYFYFISSMIDNLNLAEHGTGIRAAWLTNMGEYVLSILDNPEFTQIIDKYYGND